VISKNQLTKLTFTYFDPYQSAIKHALTTKEKVTSIAVSLGLGVIAATANSFTGIAVFLLSLYGIANYFKNRHIVNITKEFKEKIDDWVEEKREDAEYFNRKSAGEKIKRCYETKSNQIDLTNLTLTSLPLELWNLSQLTLINLSKNRLSSISEKIENLSQLKYLYLSENKLETLPPNIWNLPQLEILYASKNLLISLPINTMKNHPLKELSIGGNRELQNSDEIIKSFKPNLVLNCKTKDSQPSKRCPTELESLNEHHSRDL
jgi:Leucine-rich repeat (LRR) protein